ncbi:phosphoribosyltransferase [Thermofilum pendens]|uniref:Phosphoribosyltransferase n=1 Tax=Thermofilum pendens (strain DSM 2475 / Hrk 5) TaxID=368408 RepID=A1RXU4_THEPD|nr:phosphoribosyltransferase [Thermofilum pendens Hrk 5]
MVLSRANHLPAHVTKNCATKAFSSCTVKLYVTTKTKVNTKLVLWEEVVEWCRSLAEKVKSSGFTPDIVVAIARGGYVPARLLCDFLDVHDLASIQVLHWGRAAEITSVAHVKYPYQLNLSGKRVLLVDDIVDTGDSVIVARDYILSNWKPAELKIAAMQWISPVAKIKPDFYVEEVKEWVWYQYPWTRAEDTTNFLEKIVSEGRKTGKTEWTFEELVSEFREIYGIDVGEKYYRLALNRLVEMGLLEKKGERYIAR